MPALPGDLHHRLDQPRRERALVVVLQQQRVGVGKGVASHLDQAVEVGAVEQRVHLVVDTDDLLGPGDDAGLGRGGAAGHRHDVPVIQASDRELLTDGGAIPIVSHHPDQMTGGAERRHVGRDVGGATQLGLAVPDGHDRHRRLGRDPFGVADEIAVDHDVADHHDPARLHLLDQLHHPVAGERRSAGHRKAPLRLRPRVAWSRPSKRSTVRPSSLPAFTT